MIGPGQSQSLLAPAKINLTLQILGRRPDGYHELESLVAFAGTGDRLLVEPAEELIFEVTGPFAGQLAHATGDNLVLAATRLLAQAAGIQPRVRLQLTKNLPVGAGLGGGSADAAAVLQALRALWGLSFSPDFLASLALPLGADLPVCLYGRPALMRGIGARLTPAPPLPPLWLVLVNPGESLATGCVYQARQGPFSRPSDWWSCELPDAATAARLLRAKPNDLQAPACGLCPSIGLVLAALEKSPACLLARMSGSGASCFGLYGREEEAQAAAARLAADHPDWWVVAAPLLHLGSDS